LTAIAGLTNAGRVARRLRKLLLVAVVVAILVLLAFSIVLVRRTPAFPPLPSPNAYDDFLKAHEASTGPIRDFPTLSQDELRELIATNTETLRILRQGLSRTCCEPTEAIITNFSATMPQLAGFKALGQLLAADGRLAELDNRPADAAASYCDAILLGNEVSRGGLIIHRLVGVAIEAIGGTRLAKVLPQLDAEQRAAVIARLEHIEDVRVTWPEVMRNENAYVRHELRKIPNLVQMVVGWWQSRPARTRAVVRHDLTVAHLRLDLAELALQSYRSQNGHGPGMIEELVPRYIKSLPLDPFSGRALVYKPHGTNWVLYSIGPDRVDNGGRPVGRGSAKGDVFYDSPW
jgi:hypothetical protein